MEDMGETAVELAVAGLYPLVAAGLTAAGATVSGRAAGVAGQVAQVYGGQ